MRLSATVYEISRGSIYNTHEFDIVVFFFAKDVVQQYGVYEFTTLDTLRRWNDAETACETWGGHLASSTDSGENRFISDLVVSGKFMWASANQG